MIKLAFPICQISHFHVHLPAGNTHGRDASTHMKEDMGSNTTHNTRNVEKSAEAIQKYI
jgi:hypothetical protein